MSRGTLPTTPTPQTSDKNERLRLMAFALGGALRGDPQFAQQALALQEMKKQENLAKYAGNYLRSQGANEEMIKLVSESPTLASQILTSTFDFDKPSSVEEFEYAQRQGYTGTYADFKKSGAMSFNIDQTTETDFAKSLVELGKKDLEDTRELSATSNELLPKLETAQIIVQGEDFKTGPTQELTLDLKTFYNDITGQDATEVNQQQLFNALSSYTIPRMRPPGSGATSDFEANLFSQATIGLGNTKEANELLLGTMIQQAKRDQILLELKEDYFKKFKGDTTGFNRFIRKNDLVPALYQQINLQTEDIGDLFDKGKIRNGEVYIDVTNPRQPRLTVFRLTDFD